jgi:outer membrane protein assembly factor BamE (lipoprotein component of BamABCDE complex)
MGIRTTLALAGALALAGCAGTNFKAEDTAKIHNGMTEAEVVAILGKPYGRSQVGTDTLVLTWTYATAFGGAKSATYRFVDGKVVGSTTLNQ